MEVYEKYMHRCLQLAKLAAGKVAPNPMVGAVLVYQDKIIGEGYHREYGKPHAEVNCIASVHESEQHLISQSTLYVSLEPCSHFGKTPPCSDLIIKCGIPSVVVGCRDPFPLVNGKGIEKLQQHGIKVTTGVLKKECIELNKRFFTFHQQHRPYIILKWAQTANKKIANDDFSRIFISNEFSNRLVHQWRSEEAAILIGTNTALFDDPHLTTRLWSGNHPIRLVIDMNLRLPVSLKIFDQQVPTIIFNARKHEEHNNLLFYQVTPGVSLVHQVVHALYQLNIQSVLVEGGQRLLQSFIDEKMWDEARVITNPSMRVTEGIPAPSLSHEAIVSEDSYDSDLLEIFINQ
jgi:diaminohydroxyphosphoribosylaminopyrimidine deaminase / 5-amino-6-(5-phosphoribosylamino)uracil reductase